MKKLLFGTIATLVFGFNAYSQMNDLQLNENFNTKDSNIIVDNHTFDESFKLSCTKINVGINVFVAWGSVDIYVGCGFPSDYFYPTGCRPISEKLCNTINQLYGKTVSYDLNVKDFFKDVDLSKVTSLEITESSSWIDDDGKKASIRLGKHDVKEDGSFILEIVKE